MKIRFFIILFFAMSISGLFGQNTWSFVSAPDWHAGEREVSPPVDSMQIEQQLNAINDMKGCNPELLLIDGDLAAGPWVGQKWITQFAPGGTQQEAIINVCQVAYGNLKQRFEENGFTKMLVGIGDHEIGEDSNWKPGSEVSRLLPVYRDAFQRIWNRDEQGRFIYSDPIGSAASRPIGTAWENTSFAYKYKNVLFVTVDIYNQPDPDKPVGYLQRSINGDMPKEHLQWFENVLKEARKDSQIKHIIVQAHSPIIAPVRGQKTSMLYIEELDKSSFWKAMQKYRVDLYFAGEVHAPSAQRIKDEFPIQVVHGGYAGKNYLSVEVSEYKLYIKLRETNGKKYSDIGEMIIDKSSENTIVKDKGMLRIINPEEALIHYTFDVKEKGEIPNQAQMAKYYNLKTEAGLTEGIQGKSMDMNGSEVAECQGYGVMTRNHPSTFIAWVRTSQKGDSYIASNGGEATATGIFDIVIKDDHLAVYAAANSCLQTSAEGTEINDGRWHQLAVVFPVEGKTLKNAKLYVDGQLKDTWLAGTDQVVMVRPAYKMILGGPHNKPSAEFTSLGIKNHTGSIDEVSVWFRALSENEIQKYYQSVLNK